jgi:putative component of membrane protein insertase Oxa1/YidC/SpoIIIJ protein YidD
LEEYTSSCGTNSVYHLFAVVNNGAAVTLSDLTIKFWPYDTSGVNLVGQITTGGCVWNPTCSHNVTGVSMSAVHFSPACGPTTTQMANWEMTISTTDNTVLSGGTSWVSLQTLVNRSDSQPFVPGTSYWYSPCVLTSTYSTNSHYAIYLKGNLVTASGGVPPSCRPLPTCTPNGGGKALKENSLEGFTSTETPTPVPTRGALLQSVVAAPNLSTGGQPIQFLVNLSRPAQVRLNLYALTGEQVYSAQAEGGQGLNTLIWKLQNQAGQSVASGLYIYELQVNDGTTQESRVGKAVVLH